VFEDLIFYLFSALALAGSVVVVSNKNPVMSAISLVLTLFSTAALFILLHAQFVAVVQVLVYTGAIIVLFLFTLMLLNLHKDKLRFDAEHGKLRLAALILMIVLIGTVSHLFFKNVPLQNAAASAEGFGTVEGVATLLFTRYLLPFELTSILIVVAIVGVVSIAKRRLD